MVNHTNTSDEQGCRSTENPKDITTENGGRATKNTPCGLSPLGIQAIFLYKGLTYQMIHMPWMKQRNAYIWTYLQNSMDTKPLK